MPTVVAKVPEGPIWVHETKHDGYRMMVIRKQDRVRLISRGGHDWARAELGAVLPAEHRGRAEVAPGAFRDRLMNIINNAGEHMGDLIREVFERDKARRKRASADLTA